MKDVLRCPFCGRAIDAPTGLMELNAMRDHLRLVHQLPLDANQALELRAVWEKNGARVELPE